MLKGLLALYARPEMWFMAGVIAAVIVLVGAWLGADVFSISFLSKTAAAAAVLPLIVIALCWRS